MQWCKILLFCLINCRQAIARQKSVQKLKFECFRKQFNPCTKKLYFAEVFLIAEKHSFVYRWLPHSHKSSEWAECYINGLDLTTCETCLIYRRWCLSLFCQTPPRNHVFCLALEYKPAIIKRCPLFLAGNVLVFNKFVEKRGTLKISLAFCCLSPTFNRNQSWAQNLLTLSIVDSLRFWATSFVNIV